MKVRRFFFHNFGWKLASLTFAVLLWIAVVGEPEVATMQSAHVYYSGLAQHLVLLDDPEGVQLELRGPAPALDRENLNSIKILLDLSNVLTPGPQAFGVSAENVTLPAGVTLLAAVPSRIVLEFDRRANKSVPVQAVIKGRPGTGYVVASHSVNPPSMVISGPEKRLAAIKSVLTSEIDITDAKALQELRVNAYVSDPLVQLASPAVTVRLNIEKGSDSSRP